MAGDVKDFMTDDFVVSLNDARSGRSRDDPAVMFPLLDSPVDWNTPGVTTPVMYQRQCGSSWCFSSTGAWTASTGSLVSLFEQQSVGCGMMDSFCYSAAVDVMAVTVVATSVTRQYRTRRAKLVTSKSKEQTAQT